VSALLIAPLGSARQGNGKRGMERPLGRMFKELLGAVIVKCCSGKGEALGRPWHPCKTQASALPAVMGTEM